MAIPVQDPLWQSALPYKAEEGGSEPTPPRNTLDIYQSFCDLSDLLSKTLGKKSEEKSRTPSLEKGENQGEPSMAAKTIYLLSPLPIEKILKDIDEILHLFTIDFLSKELRIEFIAALEKANGSRSLYHIMAGGDYPFAERYRQQFFRYGCYTHEGKRWLIAEICQAEEKIVKKVDELQTIANKLRQEFINPYEQGRAIKEIEAQCALLQRPLPMLNELKRTIEETPCNVKIGKRTSHAALFDLSEIIDLREIEQLE